MIKFSKYVWGRWDVGGDVCVGWWQAAGGSPYPKVVVKEVVDLVQSMEEVIHDTPLLFLLVPHTSQMQPLPGAMFATMKFKHLYWFSSDSTDASFTLII